MSTDATSNAGQPKSRRRWYQYSLRTLLIVVTLAGCGFGWLGWKVREARQQQSAVAVIEKLGGRVIYDYGFDSQGNELPTATPPGPAWLRSLVGDDCFRCVCCVYLDITPGKSADLQYLKCFTHLNNLEISDTQAADGGLEYLKGLAELGYLRIRGPQVTDAVLEHLKCLTQLKLLTLDGTQVTDAGLANLQQALPGCEIDRTEHWAP